MTPKKQTNGDQWITQVMDPFNENGAYDTISDPGGCPSSDFLFYGIMVFGLKLIKALMSS